MATLATVVRDPHIPYLASIPGGLQHGRMIRINGRMLEHDRFNVNIQCSPAISPLDEVNLHLSIRPNESAIIRNHYTGNAWGPEERFGGCPIHYNTPFELLILAESDKFKVAVNGRHFCEFRHRLPLARSSYFYIDGRVVINSIALEGDTPTAPPLSALTTSMPSYQATTPYQQRPTYQRPMYQPPSYQSATPYQPMQQHIQQHHGSHHAPGTISTSTYATPTHHHTSTYHGSSYSYQPPPSGTVTVTNPKSGNNTALKVAAGIGGIGIGAYALSKIFDNSDSD